MQILKTQLICARHQRTSCCTTAAVAGQAAEMRADLCRTNICSDRPEQQAKVDIVAVLEVEASPAAASIGVVS